MTTLDMPIPGQPKFSREQSFGLVGQVIFGFLLAFALIGVCGWWAVTSTISGAVIASGTVKVVEDLKIIQHRDGGIIAEIAVRQGDSVEAGQVLIRLDDAQTRAELAIIKGQLEVLEGRRVRLVAERDGHQDLVFPASFDTPDVKLAELMAGESQLFVGNLLGRSRQKEQLILQQEQLGQEVSGLESQLAALSEEIALARTEHEKLQSLAKDKLIEGSRISASERELTRMQGQRGEIEASVARARARIGEVKLQVLSIDETARNDAQRELRQIDAQTAELDERLIATEDRLSRTDIRAPIAGVINELHVTTLGGVITPAETLVTIVPLGAELKVEVHLRTVDVDQIRVGGPARLRFSAFNSRTTPEISASVTRVSAAAQRDSATGETYYIADLSFQAEDLTDGLDLRPGMPVEAFVETAQMSPLDYLTKPFTDQVKRAFREE
jgi:HlyD family secretion protein